MTRQEIKPLMLVRHKGGKTYLVLARESGPAKTEDGIQWGGMWVGEKWVPDYGKVYCVQWQINEKHPQGRQYQARKELKLSDLHPI